MNDLITLEEYKAAAGISSTTNDARMSSLITSVSQLVKTYCGHSIVDHYVNPKCETVNIDSTRTKSIQLNEGPVRSIITVEVRNNTSEAYRILTDSEFYIDPDIDSLYYLSGGYSAFWPTGLGAVKVTYTAGYDQVPADLRLAVIDLVDYYYKDEHKQRYTLSGATVDNQGTSSQYRNVGFPDHIKRVLDLYKYTF